MAFLVVLESMTPAERVAFVLHDVFRFPFAEVAEIVGRTPAACRQLASSARRRLRASQEQPRTPYAESARIVREFRKAWEARDIDGLVGLLDPDATATADSGGIVTAELHPIMGGEHVARALLTVADQAPGMALLEHTVNGEPGLVARVHGDTVTVFAFDIAGSRIRRLWAVRNPEKLQRWGPAPAE
jgi:RNA polymerase sigma-70 factor (ECF subfamily)